MKRLLWPGTYSTESTSCRMAGQFIGDSSENHL